MKTASCESRKDGRESIERVRFLRKAAKNGMAEVGKVVEKILKDNDTAQFCTAK